jgi:hypothetical protein
MVVVNMVGFDQSSNFLWWEAFGLMGSFGPNVAS